MNILLVNAVVQPDCGEPVGILCLASFLRIRGHQVDIFDPQIHGDEDLVELEQKCSTKAYGLVGISVLTSSDHSLTLVGLMVERVLTTAPGTRICCGGIGASLRPFEFAALPGLEFVIVGEGEKALESLIKALERGENPAGLPGLVSRTDGLWAPIEAIADLDTLPFMARDTLVERLKGVPNKNRNSFEVRIFSGRGCNGNCTFCANASITDQRRGPRIRQRNIKQIADEMEKIHEDFGTVRFSFWDDNFLPNGAAGEQKARTIRSVFNGLSFRPSFGIQTRCIFRWIPAGECKTNRLPNTMIPARECNGKRQDFRKNWNS